MIAITTSCWACKLNFPQTLKSRILSLDLKLQETEVFISYRPSLFFTVLAFIFSLPIPKCLPIFCTLFLHFYLDPKFFPPIQTFYQVPSFHPISKIMPMPKYLLHTQPFSLDYNPIPKLWFLGIYPGLDYLFKVSNDLDHFAPLPNL